MGEKICIFERLMKDDNMKKLISILIGIASVVGVQAQDMKTLFVSMPDSIAPLLTKVNREDCIDFLASNMKAEVKNRFGKTAELKKLTDDYLQLQTTSRSTLEMKLLPLNDSVKIVCMVNTVCASAADVRYASSLLSGKNFPNRIMCSCRPLKRFIFQLIL